MTRRKKQTKFLFAAIFLCLLFACSVSPSQCAKITEWKMVQRHHLSGVSTCFFTPNAVRIESKNFGWVIISKAPDWNLNAFRLDDRVRCTITRLAFYKKRLFYPKKNCMRRLTLIGTHTVGPLQAKVYRTSAHEFWVGKLKGVNAPVEHMIVALHEAPEVDGMLLRLVRYSAAGPGPEKKDTSFFSMNARGAVIAVETDSLKEIPYNASDFVVPSAFRLVRDSEQVMTSSARRKDAESALEELGVGEQLGGSSKRK